MWRLWLSWSRLPLSTCPTVLGHWTQRSPGKWGCWRRMFAALPPSSQKNGCPSASLCSVHSHLMTRRLTSDTGYNIPPLPRFNTLVAQPDPRPFFYLSSISFGIDWRGRHLLYGTSLFPSSSPTLGLSDVGRVSQTRIVIFCFFEGIGATWHGYAL